MEPYTKALAAFRLEGDTAKARKLLDAARKANKFVPDFLLDRKLLPQQPPPLHALGTEEEAIMYAANALSGWKGTPGATDWLKQSQPRKKKKKTRDKSQGPSPLLKKQLADLPQVFDVWQVDFRHFGSRIEEGGELFNPWLILIASVSSGLILAQDMSLEPPTANMVWDVLAKAVKVAHRPTEIQVRPGELWDELEPHLDEVDVPLVPTEELDMLDFLFADPEKEHGGG